MGVSRELNTSGRAKMMESVCGSLQKGKGRIPMKIGFVGLGNMATAIIGGLLREGTTFSGEDGDATVITAANIIGLGQDRGHATEARRAIRHRRHCQQPRSCRSGRCAGARRKAPVLPRSDRRNSRGRKREHTGYLYRRWSHTRAHRGPFQSRCYRHAAHPLHGRTPRPS